MGEMIWPELTPSPLLRALGLGRRTVGTACATGILQAAYPAGAVSSGESGSCGLATDGLACVINWVAGRLPYPESGPILCQFSYSVISKCCRVFFLPKSISSGCIFPCLSTPTPPLGPQTVFKLEHGL